MLKAVAGGSHLKPQHSTEQRELTGGNWKLSKPAYSDKLPPKKKKLHLLKLPNN